MIDPESEIPVYWQVSALRFMLRSYLHDPEPDEAIERWLDEAGDADGVYLRWAIRTAYTVSTMSATALQLALERLQAGAEALDI